MFTRSKPKPSSPLLQDPITLLKLAADTQNLRAGTQIHARLVISGQNDAVVGANSLINLYAKCGRVRLARQLFDRMRDRNVVSWSALMAGYSRQGLSSEVLGLFMRVARDSNVCPNEFVLTTAISSCSAGEGRQCHGYAVKSGFVFHSHVKNALVHMYSRCSSVEEAMRVFDTVPGCDVFAYNSVLNGLLERGRVSEAVEVLRTMLSERVDWDSVTCVAVFGLCSKLGSLRLGMEVHCRVLRNGIECDSFVRSSIVDMYGKCGKLGSAIRVFEGMPMRPSYNVVSWTTIMAACFQNGCFEEALNLFAKMRIEGVGPNEITFAVLLNSSACLSVLRHGDLLHACAEKSGFEGHIIVRNALINMYAKSGNIEAANEVFLGMERRDIITWNAIITGFSRHGLGRETLNVFEDMISSGDYPNYVTFVGVLSACAHLGLVQQGFYYLTQLMKEFGVKPGVEHHTCIVGLLSRAGWLDEAANYMSSVPVKWDIVAWRTLLSACYVHQNYSLGRRVAETVVKMDPNDVGTYLLLSNMYAKAKRWDGVVKIRKMMRERSVKKEPGVSWVEIKGTTHVFVSEDNSHPECREIYAKVRDLLSRIRLLGYVPDNASVLHDVEDEQKEDYLSHHSEKLAIAYALMKMPSEAPIRVIKNLRMCDDCHSAVKLIAKLTNRLIVVRDANRFHHFRDGFCSCVDYW